MLTKAPHQEELDRKRRLLAKIKTIRDAVLVNRGEVRGEETKLYRWVNLKAERQLWFQTVGWTKVGAQDPVETLYKQDDGTHVRGDLILYQIDKEFGEALHLFDVVRGVEMVEGAKESFEATAEREGVPTFRPAV
jgi:hypothetical protein